MTDENFKDALFKVHTLDYIDRVYTKENQLIAKADQGSPTTGMKIHARVDETSAVSQEALNKLNTSLELCGFEWEGLQARNGHCWLIITEQVNPTQETD